MRKNIDERGKKLFIGGLHMKTSEESLKSFYAQWGEIVDCVVMKDNQTQRSRGFGFVTYKDADSVDAAQNNRPHTIDGIKVDSKRAMPKEDTSPENHATVNRLFLGKLKKSITNDDLYDYFGQYGSITEAVVIKNPNGESRGFGFVTFDDPDSVDKIIVTRPHYINGQSIEVKKAQPKDSKDSSQKNAFNSGNVGRGGGPGGRGGGRGPGAGKMGGRYQGFGTEPVMSGAGDYMGGRSGYGVDGMGRGGGGGYMGGGGGGGGGGYGDYSSGGNDYPPGQFGECGQYPGFMGGSNMPPAGYGGGDGRGYYNGPPPSNQPGGMLAQLPGPGLGGASAGGGPNPGYMGGGMYGTGSGSAYSGPPMSMQQQQQPSFVMGDYGGQQSRMQSAGGPIRGGAKFSSRAGGSLSSTGPINNPYGVYPY